MRDARARIPFAELGAVIVDKKTKVGKRRHFPAKRFIQGNVLWRGDEPFLAANDVCDFHQVVVDDVGKVVRRIAVRLYQDKVLFTIFLLKRAVDGVTRLWAAKLVAAEAHYMRLASVCTALGLSIANGAAGAWIYCWLACFVELLLLRLKLFRGTEAAVSIAFVDELADMLLVDGESF